MSPAVFADTFYWIAIARPRDPWHVAVLNWAEAHRQTAVVTTDEVVMEYLNGMSKAGSAARRHAATTVHRIRMDPRTTVLPQTRDDFDAALALYEARLDKAYSLPDTDGLDALERILDRSPKTKVVMFTAHESPTYVARAAALGAAEFVLKGASAQEIVAALKRAHSGIRPEPDSLMGKIQGTMARRRPTYDDDIPLTNREVQILRHVALGLSNREIGRSLEISIETVKEHVQNILRKLEAGDRTEAAVWAVRKGLV